MKLYPNHLIIGYGEIGSALWEIFAGGANCYFVEKERRSRDIPRKIEIMHVCIPYSATFIKDVKHYQEEFEPKYTVIHSTVPVGTSIKLDAIHSPIRGIHPNLTSGVRTFVKFLGGHEAGKVADVFRRFGMRVMLFDKSETTEAMKLFDTEYYRTCIEFAQRVKRYCDKHKLNFHEVYTLANETYNDGYAKLGHPEFVRPVLQPIMEPIGGHCLVPNSKLIKLSENG